MPIRQTNWVTGDDTCSVTRPSRGAASHPVFSLVVLTAPLFFSGEAAFLEGLLAAGLEKLHLRKPEADKEEMETLLQQIDVRWHPRLVLHPWAGRAGSCDEALRLAARYGIPQIHCSLKEMEEPNVPKTEPIAGAPVAVSSSLHSWEEIKDIRGMGLTYVFLSPVFDSISKPGYAANPDLWRRPDRPYPCKVIGLGGIDKDSMGELIREGWDGAAVLGWIWEEPDRAVERYKQLKKIIASHCL